MRYTFKLSKLKGYHIFGFGQVSASDHICFTQSLNENRLVSMCIVLVYIDDIIYVRSRKHLKVWDQVVKQSLVEIFLLSLTKKHWRYGLCWRDCNLSIDFHVSYVLGLIFLTYTGGIVSGNIMEPMLKICTSYKCNQIPK